MNCRRFIWLATDLIKYLLWNRSEQIKLTYANRQVRVRDSIKVMEIFVSFPISDSNNMQYNPNINIKPKENKGNVEYLALQIKKNKRFYFKHEKKTGTVVFFLNVLFFRKTIYLMMIMVLFNTCVFQILLNHVTSYITSMNYVVIYVTKFYSFINII